MILPLEFPVKFEYKKEKIEKKITIVKQDFSVCQPREIRKKSRFYSKTEVFIVHYSNENVLNIYPIK